MHSVPQLKSLVQINKSCHKTSILHISDLLSCTVDRTTRSASRVAIEGWGFFSMCFLVWVLFRLYFVISCMQHLGYWRNSLQNTYCSYVSPSAVWACLWGNSMPSISTCWIPQVKVFAPPQEKGSALCHCRLLSYMLVYIVLLPQPGFKGVLYHRYFSHALKT